MLDRRFRSFLMVFSLLIVSSIALGQAGEEGFEQIFDGKSLAGWDGDSRFWSVQEGNLTGRTTDDNKLESNTFLVWRAGKVADFDLRLKVRCIGGNTGIQYRSQEDAKVKYRIGGYQADFDATGKWIGILYDERGRAILATRGQKVTVGDDAKPQVTADLGTAKAVEDSVKENDWNEYRVLAVGNRLQHFVNGIQSVDVTDNDLKNREMSGLLALQLHAGPSMTVSFKDVRIKHIDQSAAKAESENADSKDIKKVIFVAGTKSHGYGSHEHYAGSVLLAKRLEAVFPGINAEVVRNGWPANEVEAFADADAIVMYADGGGGHPVLPHLESIDAKMKQGVGLVCLHYGVEVPKGPAGDAFLDWIGGYFETHWSVNPHWTAQFSEFPDHPITRGVKPFKVNDEWYFHMRFRDNMVGVTPILTAIPPASTMSRPDGAHSGNPTVRRAVASEKPQHVAWCTERADGGRGFGLTGGHYHESWANDDMRRLVVNAIAWAAKVDIPEQGIQDEAVSPAELELNQDYPKPVKQ